MWVLLDEKIGEQISYKITDVSLSLTQTMPNPQPNWINAGAIMHVGQTSRFKIPNSVFSPPKVIEQGQVVSIEGDLAFVITTTRPSAPKPKMQTYSAHIWIRTWWDGSAMLSETTASRRED